MGGSALSRVEPPPQYERSSMPAATPSKPRAEKPQKRFMVANQSFSALVGGQEYTLIGGETILEDSHVVVVAHPQFFQPVESNQ
jgi:hypothetical protein